MDTDRWQRIDELFQAALELPAETRGRFVEQNTADDPELRATLTGMLEAHEDEAFLETPVAEGWAAAPGLQEESAPDRIGRYDVVRKLGAGGDG